jgi:purine-binding chemotaxis protein CheW
MQLCTYKLADTWFGVDATKVQEVLRRQTLTPAPLAPAHVAGLLNIRGRIVTALYLHGRMGLERQDREPLHIVVNTANEPVSLLVDSIGGVVDVTDDDFEPAPPTTPPALRALVHGAYKLPDRLILVLNIESAVS